MIKVENLVKRYGSNYALNDVSFEIGDGQIVGLLGPNGAGKSTAMNIITGYLAPTSGTVTVNGVDIKEDPMAVKRNIGYLPEQPPVYPEMTVDEYLNFVYELKGCTLPRAAHLDEIVGVTRLSDIRHRLIAHLSKGYRQRVGIAQALIGNPAIIIFDEPTVGLDPKQVLEVRNLLRTLAKEHTVILSTHILSEVQAVCERVLVVNHGNLIADRPTEELSLALEERTAYRVKILGNESEILPAVRHIGGARNVEPVGEHEVGAVTFRMEAERGVDVRKPLFFLCAEKNWPILELSPIGGDLESVFIRLVDSSERRDQR